MHTSLTQWCRSGLTVLFRHSVGTYLGNELTRKSPGNTWPQSSQLAETLWTDPGLKNGIVVRELIFNPKKKKQASAGSESSNVPPKSSHTRKKTHKKHQHQYHHHSPRRSLAPLVRRRHVDSRCPEQKSSNCLITFVKPS